MSRPALRILTTLEMLQTRGRVSGAELAQRLGVDRRTVRRYITRLEELGIPITAEQGRDGAYRLVAGFKLPPMMFTDDEALALSIGLLAARNLGLAQAAPAVASAQAKLERVMPEALQRRLRAVNETVALELTRPAATLDPTVLSRLSSAAQAQQRVHLHYRTQQDQRTQRDFDPYGLAYRIGRWYVVGHCHLRRGLRSFRLDRILQVQPLAASFGRPAQFDALDYLRQSMATMPRLHPIEVFLHTDLVIAQRELFPALGVIEAAPGGVLLHGQADDLDWVARELARLPFAFEVRGPAALQSALAGLAARLSSAGTAPHCR